MNKEDLIKREIERHEKAISDLRAESSRECSTKPTVVALVLDESGSMASCQDATISGLNEYFDDRRKDVPEAPVFITKFNSKTEIVSEGGKALYAPTFNHSNYRPSGNTALYDAIGKTINSVDKYNDTHRILFVIMTDGQENASKEFTREQVSHLIEQREGKNWTFVFLAANQDAWRAAQAVGIRSGGNVVRYSSSARGQTLNSSNLRRQTSAYLAGDALSVTDFAQGETDITTDLV